MLGIDDSHFRALESHYTQAALADSGYTCPPVDDEMVRTFLAQFVETGRLPQPMVVA
jgi:hypothetical protein